MTISSGVFHQTGESEKSPNTAPEFLVLVRLKNPRITGMTARSGMRLSTMALVTWSATNTATVIAAMRIREIILAREVVARCILDFIGFRFALVDLSDSSSTQLDIRPTSIAFTECTRNQSTRDGSLRLSCSSGVIAPALAALVHLDACILIYAASISFSAAEHRSHTVG